MKNILFILLVIGLVAFGIISINTQTKSGNVSTAQPSTKNDATTQQPTLNEQEIPTVEKHQTNAEWKTFNGSDFDITLKYPEGWEVITGFAQNGTFDFECDYIKNFLKTPETCAGTYKSPMVVVRPINGTKGSFIYEGLMLWGPTSGLGGGCPECEMLNEKVIVNNNEYTIPVKIAPPTREVSTYSTFPDGGVYIKETGKKSIWGQMDLELDTDNEETYKTIIEIVKTIKPN